MKPLQARPITLSILTAATLLCGAGAALQARAGATSDIPQIYLGTWDRTVEACAETAIPRIAKLDIEPEKLEFHYGTAEISDVSVSTAENRPPVVFLRTSLSEEGLQNPEPRVAYYRLEQGGGPDAIKLTERDADPILLVRCPLGAGE